MRAFVPYLHRVSDGNHPGATHVVHLHHGEVREMTIYPEEAGFLRSPCGLLQRLREIHS
jgi:anthranilate phosphoribosyltransferase